LRVKIEPILPNDVKTTPGTIRQSARLNFRKEDFLRKRKNAQKQANRNASTLSSEGYASENGSNCLNKENITNLQILGRKN
jgi:hypothetical protein